MLNWYISQLHVDTTAREIIRDLRNRMVHHITPDGTPTEPNNQPAPTREQRKEVYRYALKVHERNRSLYYDVTRGNI